MNTLCSIYRSSKKEGAYLYVEKSVGFKDVPQALLNMFGEPVLVMTLMLKPDLRLASISRKDLCKRLEDEGYYLHVPSTDLDAEKNLSELQPKT